MKVGKKNKDRVIEDCEWLDSLLPISFGLWAQGNKNLSIDHGDNDSTYESPSYYDLPKQVTILPRPFEESCIAQILIQVFQHSREFLLPTPVRGLTFSYSSQLGHLSISCVDIPDWSFEEYPSLSYHLHSQFAKDSPCHIPIHEKTNVGLQRGWVRVSRNNISVISYFLPIKVEYAQLGSKLAITYKCFPCLVVMVRWEGERVNDLCSRSSQCNQQ